MRKLTVLIDRPYKTIDLQESLLILHEYPYTLVKRATIFWNYNNIKDENNKFEINNTIYTLNNGYYTFEYLKNFFNGNNVSIKRHPWDKTSYITPNKNKIKFNKMGLLFGLDENKVITSMYQGDDPVNMNNGLRLVNISCDLVDQTKNTYDGKMGIIITSLPVYEGY